MKIIKVCIILILNYVLICTHCFAVDSVNPTGVNVNAAGVTSVFLTFRGTAGQVTTDAFWCGEITTAANTVSTENPCVPGTFFGRLPNRLQQGQSSQFAQVPQLPIEADAFFTPQNVNGQLLGQTFTDIMTIPASVSRRAMQSARSGDKSSFFYIREFVVNGTKQYIAITCRLSGGGARVPFSLTKVQTYFDTQSGPQNVFLHSIDSHFPDVQAHISYNGTGRLKGRWELVMPGDEPPKDIDLVPQANLPTELRGLQKRYRVIQTVDKFLPPLGEITIDGPPSNLLPQNIIGGFQLLFRIEATRDKEGNSNTGVGVAISGGVSGFPIPAIKYYVASNEDVLQAKTAQGLTQEIRIFPIQKVKDTENEFQFSWQHVGSAKGYKLELMFEGETSFFAYIDASHNAYITPPWIGEKIVEGTQNQDHNILQWRIQALDKNGVAYRMSK